VENLEKVKEEEYGLGKKGSERTSLAHK